MKTENNLLITIIH